MKKIKFPIYFALLLTLLLFALPAQADEASFNMECWVKTGSSATLYQLATEDGGITVGGEGSLENDFKEAGSLSAGTYVKIINTLSGYGLDQVSYWSGGGTASGYVKSSALVDAVAVVYLDDGSGVEIP